MCHDVMSSKNTKQLMHNSYAIRISQAMSGSLFGGPIFDSSPSSQNTHGTSHQPLNGGHTKGQPSRALGSHLNGSFTCFTAKFRMYKWWFIAGKIIYKMGKSSITGWWFFATPLKNIKVNWDDDSQYGKMKLMFQTTNQLKDS